MTELTTQIDVKIHRANEIVGTIISHSDIPNGDPSCCGCLNVFVFENTAEFICNECDAVVKTVPVAEYPKVQSQLEDIVGIEAAEPELVVA